MELFWPFTVLSAEQVSRNVRVFRLKINGKKEAPDFRPGQCIFVRTEAKGVTAGRPYSIASAPEDAKNGEYEIAVQGAAGEGFLSESIFCGWSPGDTVLISRPAGEFYYRPGVDERQIAAIAGGVGITPFMSMARAFRAGAPGMPDRLVIVSAGEYEEDLIYRRELSALAAKEPALSVFFVAEHAVSDGVRRGVFDRALLESLPLDRRRCTFLACGTREMVAATQSLFASVGESGRVRFDFPGEEQDVYSLPGYPAEKKNKIFTVTVRRPEGERVLSADAGESLLTALERAGLAPYSGCRSGRCGYCSARHLSGELFIPKERDHRTDRQKADGFIRLCSSFPLGDIELSLPIPISQSE